MANLNFMVEMLKKAKAFDPVPHSLYSRAGGHEAQAATKQVMDRSDFRERLNKTGNDNDPVGTTPEEFRQVIQAQSVMWREAI